MNKMLPQKPESSPGCKVALVFVLKLGLLQTHLDDDFTRVLAPFLPIQQPKPFSSPKSNVL